MELPLELLEEPTMLTTMDNPYNPKEDYVKWLTWDHEHEYYTQEYLARVANVSIDDESTDAQLQFELAKLDILENDVEGIYRLV